MPVLTFTTSPYAPQSYSYTLSGLSLNEAGCVYLIMTTFKAITKDTITGHTDINIRPIILPTN